MSVSIINSRITATREDVCCYVRYPHREMLQIQRKSLYKYSGFPDKLWNYKNFNKVTELDIAGEFIT